jgi:DNA-binding NtrC family response regulator
MNHKPGVIVCERKGAWSAGLRRHLPREVRLRETRLLADCSSALAEAPGSLVVLELTPANLDGVLELLSDVEARYPLAAVVVVAERNLEACEALLREAGAVHFATSPRTADALARLAARHLARLPQQTGTLAARIWASLPWPEAATP